MTKSFCDLHSFLHCRLPQLDKYGIYDYCPGSVEVSSDQGFLAIAQRVEEGTTTEDFAKYVKKELDDEDLDPEQFLGMEQRLPVQRLREMWCNINLSVFRRFNSLKRMALQNDIK